MTTQLWTAQLSKTLAVETKGPFFWQKTVSPYHLLNVQLLFEASPWLTTAKHFGGAIAQNQTGDIFVSVGDRGKRLSAQSLQSQLGKVMKISFAEKNRKKAFLQTKKPKIFSLGHRNPQGLFFRIEDKTLWSAEHGPMGGDEVNRIIEEGNYGWPFVTDGKEYSGNQIDELDESKKPRTQAPKLSYTPSLAVSTLAFYPSQASESAIKALQQHVILLSLKAKQLRLLENDQGELQDKGLLIEHIHERWRNITISEKGDVFLLAESGKVYRIYTQSSLYSSVNVINNGP